MGILVTVAYLIVHFRGNKFIYCSSVAVLVFLGISLTILVKVSWPLTKFKFALVLAMAIATSVCYFTPIGRMIFGFKLISGKDLLMSAVLIVGSIPLMIVARLISSKLAKA